MARKATGWTCRKASCRAKNPPRTRKCQTCGKPRPAKKPPEHARVLTEMSYEQFIAVNGGEFCGICGRGPSPTRRLDRDHDHSTGEARGLLCHRCNRHLKNWVTFEWLVAASDYLLRARVGVPHQRRSVVRDQAVPQHHRLHPVPAPRRQGRW